MSMLFFRGHDIAWICLLIKA